MRYLAIPLLVLLVGTSAFGQEMTYTRMDSLTTGALTIGRVVQTFDLETVLSIASGDLTRTPIVLRIVAEDNGTTQSTVTERKTGTATTDTGSTITAVVETLTRQENSVPERIAVLSSVNATEVVGSSPETTGLVLNRGDKALVQINRRYLHVVALTSATSPTLSIVRVR